MSGTFIIDQEIRSIRRDMRMTQEQFVAYFNATNPKSIQLTRDMLAKYETGAVTPPADKFAKMLVIGGRI